MGIHQLSTASVRETGVTIEDFLKSGIRQRCEWLLQVFNTARGLSPNNKFDKKKERGTVGE